MRFLTRLRVELQDDGSWRLLAPFAARVQGEPIVVPEDFDTDFDSVPRLPLAYMLLGNTGLRAAVLHDWLYDARALDGAGARIPRARADHVFLEAMLAEGLPWIAARAKYAAVRLADGSRYQN